MDDFDENKKRLELETLALIGSRRRTEMTTIKIDAVALEKVREAVNTIGKYTVPKYGHGAGVDLDVQSAFTLIHDFLSTVQPQPEVTDAESEYWRIRALTAEARYQSSVKILTNIAGHLKPENIQTPDGQTYEFNPSDAIVRQHWDSLTNHIRAALLVPAVQEVTEDRFSETVGSEILADEWPSLSQKDQHDIIFEQLGNFFPNGLRIVRGEGEK